MHLCIITVCNDSIMLIFIDGEALVLAGIEGDFLSSGVFWGTGRACLRRLKKDFLQITLGFKWKRMRKHLSVGKLERRKRRFGRVVS